MTTTKNPTIVEPSVKILNKMYLISELQNNCTQQVMDLLISYMADPNCWPDLYCKDEDLNEYEKASFIYAANNFRATT